MRNRGRTEDKETDNNRICARVCDSERERDRERQNDRKKTRVIYLCRVFEEGVGGRERDGEDVGKETEGEKDERENGVI